MRVVSPSSRLPRLGSARQLGSRLPDLPGVGRQRSGGPPRVRDLRERRPIIRRSRRRGRSCCAFLRTPVSPEGIRGGLMAIVNRDSRPALQPHARAIGLALARGAGDRGRRCGGVLLHARHPPHLLRGRVGLHAASPRRGRLDVPGSTARSSGRGPDPDLQGAAEAVRGEFICPVSGRGAGDRAELRGAVLRARAAPRRRCDRAGGDRHRDVPRTCVGAARFAGGDDRAELAGGRARDAGGAGVKSPPLGSRGVRAAHGVARLIQLRTRVRGSGGGRRPVARRRTATDLGGDRAERAVRPVADRLRAVADHRGATFRASRGRCSIRSAPT